MKVALFGSVHQDGGEVQKILDVLKDKKVEVLIQEKFHRFLTSSYHLSYDVGGIIEGKDFDSDLVVSIGGDGTFLRTSAKIGDKQIPILGVNAGRLGFLADTSSSDFEQVFNDILNKEYEIEDRTQLQVDIDYPLVEDAHAALNEVAILKQDSASMINVSVTVDDEFLTNYQADGLLVSTPTGSTAYAMSVGGPIMSPKLSSFLITPVAPHTLTSRPLLIGDSATLKVKVSSRSSHYLLSLDGRSTILPDDLTFNICKAPFPLKVIRRRDKSFYKTLQDKLMWGADPREKR